MHDEFSITVRKLTRAQHFLQSYTARAERGEVGPQGELGREKAREGDDCEDFSSPFAHLRAVSVKTTGNEFILTRVKGRLYYLFQSS